MKIKIGEYEVLGHGTIVSIPNEPVRFEIEKLVCEFHFVEDSEAEEMSLKAEVLQDDQTMILTFVNFNNNLGTGNISPLKLGYINDKSLFLNYRIYALNGGDGGEKAGKTIHYTWLTKKKSKEEGK